MDASSNASNVCSPFPCWKKLTTKSCLKYTLLIIMLTILIVCFFMNAISIIDLKTYTVEAIIQTTTDTFFKERKTKIKNPLVQSSPAAFALPLHGSIFCWVLTTPNNFDTKVPAVNETWLKRCDRGQFFTTVPMKDQTIPYTTAFLGMDDSYGALFYKTIEGFHFAFTEISDEFDWYMKTDDDVYVIVEKLREFLSQFDPKIPYYIGYNFKPYLPNGYNSGGAGYVLSNAAVKIFVEELYSNRTICPNSAFEDVGMAVCLSEKGIYPMDTRNENGQHRFSPHSMKQIFETQTDHPFYIKWPEKRRYEAFAPELITFHHQTPDEIRLIEILLYRLDDPRRSKFHKF